MVGKPFQPPFGEYLLGTDTLGRDLAAGVLYGARTTLLVGVVATVIAGRASAWPIGGLAGYFGGRLDNLLMRFTELFQTIPFFLFAILLVAVLGAVVAQRHLRHRGGLLAADGTAGARRVHGDAQPRVRAGLRVAGHGPHRASSCVHILPNTLSSIIVTGSLMVATAILHRVGAVVPGPVRRQHDELGLHHRLGRAPCCAPHGGSAPCRAWPSCSP